MPDTVAIPAVATCDGGVIVIAKPGSNCDHLSAARDVSRELFPLTGLGFQPGFGV